LDEAELQWVRERFQEVPELGRLLPDEDIKLMAVE
jgi:hypothetical protein